MDYFWCRNCKETFNIQQKKIEGIENWPVFRRVLGKLKKPRIRIQGFVRLSSRLPWSTLAGNVPNWQQQIFGVEISDQKQYHAACLEVRLAVGHRSNNHCGGQWVMSPWVSPRYGRIRPEDHLFIYLSMYHCIYCISVSISIPYLSLYIFLSLYLSLSLYLYLSLYLSLSIYIYNYIYVYVYIFVSLSISLK